MPLAVETVALSAAIVANGYAIRKGGFHDRLRQGDPVQTRTCPPNRLRARRHALLAPADRCADRVCRRRAARGLLRDRRDTLERALGLLPPVPVRRRRASAGAGCLRRIDERLPGTDRADPGLPAGAGARSARGLRDDRKDA